MRMGLLYVLRMFLILCIWDFMQIGVFKVIVCFVVWSTIL